MKILKHTVQDSYGLHARPASQMVEICQPAQSEVWLSCGDRKADCKRLFSLLGVGVQCSETIVLHIEGPDEDQVYTKLETYILENSV